MLNTYDYILNSLKESIKQARQKTSIVVNEQLLLLYWEIGKTILDQQAAEGWGTKVIKRLANDLRSEFPDMKGLSERNLKYMRAFAETYPDQIVQVPPAQIGKGGKQAMDSKVQVPLAQLTWYHHITLLEKVKDEKQRLFYIHKTVENGWSRNVMLTQIESELYKRQGAAITNFKSTLAPGQSDLAIETIKSPYVFDFLSLGDQMRERDLENALIHNMKKFLLELGKGFAYVGNQYNLEVEGSDYFLDLLFYNTKLHCYVVFELKVGEFKPEYAGKLNFYVNTVDAQIRTDQDAPTMGVLLCKTPNQTVIEYSLKGVDKPLGVAGYQLSKALPDNLKEGLPTVEELEKELEKEIEIHISPLEQKLEAIRQKVASLKNEPVKEHKTKEHIVTLAQRFLYPLYDQIMEKTEELRAMFKYNRTTFDVISHGFYKKEDFEKKLQEESNVYKIGVSINFDGFMPAGTEAFQVYQGFHLNFQELKYQLHYKHDRKPHKEWLYHQVPSKREIEDFATLIADNIASQVFEMITSLENRNA